MFPLSRIIYMPVSPSTTLIGPISTDFPFSHPGLFNFSPNLNSLVEHKIVQPYRLKRIRDNSPKKSPKSISTNHDGPKNALMLLHEFKPSIEYKLIRRAGPSHRPIFTMAVEINGQTFEGTAQTKKEAKQAAAEKALRSLSENESNKFESHLNPIKHENTCLPQFADRIAKCIQDKFQQITENDVRLQRRKVLSGIVLTRNQNLESLEIICITTGTKTLPSHQRIPNGQSLHDCHAEIIARRCLIRYCYEQLNLYLNGETNQSIFERIEKTNRFRLKTHIDFHLYISTTPCGDSRLFSLCETKHSTRSVKKSRGQLRKKIEVADGTISLFELMHNERLLTMSCSDKLCRWNFLGLQGALLSVLIEPIYYANMIIGSVFSHEQIQRALFSRIEKLIDLPSPYELRVPMIFNVSHPEMRTTIRGPNHGFIWNCIDQKLEIIDTLSGLTITHEPSTISKAVLFQQWIDLMIRLKSETIPMIYFDAKQLAADYQKAKMMINQAFVSHGFGQWLSKSPEEDAFDLSVK